MPTHCLRARAGVLVLWALGASLSVLACVGAAAAQPAAASAGVGSSTVPTASYQDLLAQGKALLKADKYDEALGLFAAAIQQAQAEGQPATTLSYLYCLQGIVQVQGGSAKRADAIASLHKSLELDPSSADCRFELAKSQYEDKQYSEAQRSAEAVAAQAGADAALISEAGGLAKRAQVQALFSDGRRLLKGREPEAAAARIKEATDKAEAAGLSSEERSLMHYVRVLALRQASEDAEAVKEARVGLALSPQDADLHFELAQALFDTDEFVPAQKAAEEALRLGLSDSSDQKAASDLFKKAKTEALHERFTFFGSVSFGYDSNVLQSGKVETVGGKCASCPNNTRTASQDSSSAQSIRDQLRQQVSLIRSLFSQYPTAVTEIYKTAVPPQEEWDLPIPVSLDLNGRLFRFRTLEMWLGYRFYQLFMTSAGFDHDAYNLQEHTVPLSLSWQPARWLMLRPRVEGFANFSGLKAYTPYQGGLLAVFDALFIESRMWRTRLLYQHQLRRSFNRSDDTYLDGDRDEVRLTQELRAGSGKVRVRGSLSYRLRSDRTGVYEDDVAFSPSFYIQDRTGMLSQAEVTLGSFRYVAPLGYLGHEASTRWRLSVPWDLELLAGFAFDYRAYAGEYSATFTPQSAMVRQPCPPGSTLAMCDPRNQPVVSLPPAGSASSIAMPATQRKDSTISVDVTVSKNLPLGFSLDLSYAFVKNFSNIANGIDNRNYNKHQVTLSAGYAF